MEMTYEKKINDYPDTVSLKGTEEIVKQMKKSICKILLGKKKGTGFFCKIPFGNNLLPVLITNNHIIDEIILKEKKISLAINNEQEYKEILLEGRIQYTNKNYDITIIEMKKEDNISDYLDLDKKIDNKLYERESIYIIHYGGNKSIGVSYGIIYSIEGENNFHHFCNTESGSSGAPVLNLSNNKVIGIHSGTKNSFNFNIGLFMKNALNDFINKKKYLIERSEELQIENNIKNNIEEFNKKFRTNIKDLNLTKLELWTKGIGNEGLKYLGEYMQFKELKELRLYENKISDIKPLEKMKYEKLEILDLGRNKISDISICLF